MAHFADVARVIRDLPINLPKLASAYTSKAIIKAISTTLLTYRVTSNRLDYFILDNATNNITIITALA